MIDVIAPGRTQELTGVEGPDQIALAAGGADQGAADAGCLLHLGSHLLHGHAGENADQKNRQQKRQRHHRQDRFQHVERQHEDQGERNVENGGDVVGVVGVLDGLGTVDHLAAGFRRNLFDGAGFRHGQHGIAVDGGLFVGQHAQAPRDMQARLAKGQFEEQRDEDADGQGRERRVDAVADIAVQHLHDEQRLRQCQDVDE